MTALTSSFSIDILGVQRRTGMTEQAGNACATACTWVLRHLPGLVLMFKWGTTPAWSGWC
jgi:hypothetical protein